MNAPEFKIDTLTKDGAKIVGWFARMNALYDHDVYMVIENPHNRQWIAVSAKSWWIVKV